MQYQVESIKNLRVLWEFRGDGDVVDGDYVYSSEYIYSDIGNYFIEKIEVNNCGDKGLSVGETSVVKMKNLVSKNAKIGLASKDYSKVFSENIQTYDTETCISAYQKKKEFSRMFFWNICIYIQVPF